MPKPIRGCWHWTGGSYVPNQLDKDDYHLLITGDCELIKMHPFTERLPYSLSDRNTGTINIAVCGNFGADTKNFGEYPVTWEQVELMIEATALVSLLKVVPYTKWWTHAEYAIEDRYYPLKWDLAILKPDNTNGYISIKSLAAATGTVLRLLLKEKIADIQKTDYSKHPLMKEILK